MSNEDSYQAHRRRLREEGGLPPVDDAGEVQIVDLPSGRGFVTSTGQFFLVVDEESGEAVPGSESWPFDGRTPEEQIAYQRRVEGVEGDK